MSTTSVRRLKDRGGAGSKIMASKPSKSMTPPVSDKSLHLDNANKSSTWKDSSSRSISRTRGGLVSQKPTIRPMPRIDRSAASDGESKKRLSSSSVPRGRSSSPFDFTRNLSDLRQNRVSSKDSGDKEPSHAISRLGSSGFRALEKKGVREPTPKASDRVANRLRVNAYCKENDSIGLTSVKRSGKFEDNKELKSNVDRSECRLQSNRLDVTLSPNVPKTNLLSFDAIPEIRKNGFSAEKNACIPNNGGCTGKLDARLKRNAGTAVEKDEKTSSLKVISREVVTSLKSKDLSKAKEVNAHCSIGGLADKKYSSKLHEKLAFLEGKVQRIASDITRTKEMLDLNNPDASKLIISGIRDKISGIEKAMGHVIGESHGKLSHPIDIGTDIVQAKVQQSNQIKHADSHKVTMKGLPSEELEARLFPHHMLLKNRTSSIPLSSSSDGGHAVLEPSSESTSADKLPSVDENLIAVEIPSSLSKEQCKVAIVDGDLYPEVNEVQETEGAGASAADQQSSNAITGQRDVDMDLTADESLDDFDDQENKPTHFFVEEIEDNSIYQFSQLGQKTSTGGWFFSEGESVLLAHDNGSCSFYDIANHEEKAEYKPPSRTLPNIWKDCWIVRAASPDGCSGKYVVAASAGNSSDTGFCSWDFYSKEVRAFHIEEKATSSRQILGTRSALSASLCSDNQQFWYKPSGPLMASTATSQRAVKVFDIRDGEQIMKWDVQKPVLMMDYSSSLQWRNRGKVVIAEADAISLWDVNSLRPQALLNVSSGGRQISALHVNNIDAEVGGGVRQRVSSSEAEGNDGVFCTADSINIMDFRQPSGIGLKIPKIGTSVQSIFSRGDSLYLGSTTMKSADKKQICSQVQQFSLRKQKLVSTYLMPVSSSHSGDTAPTQVWGNSNFVMGVCERGLFVFDASRDDVLPSFALDYSSPHKAREVIGPNDLYAPSFDYASSQILLISRDRPAMWRQLS